MESRITEGSFELHKQSVARVAFMHNAELDPPTNHQQKREMGGIHALLERASGAKAC